MVQVSPRLLQQLLAPLSLLLSPAGQQDQTPNSVLHRKVERDPIRTGTPRSQSRSATRRPVLPVPPTIKVAFCGLALRRRGLMKPPENVRNP